LRLYENKYISVTSIIDLREPFDDKAFKEWCEKNGKDEALISANSRVLGDKVSRLIEYHHLDIPILEPVIGVVEKELRQGVKKFLKDWDVEQCEVGVVCEDLNYAGTFDGIIKNKKTGKIYIADWKTYGAYKKAPYKRDSGKIKKCRWQLSLYRHAYGEDLDMAVVVFKNDGEYLLEELKFDKEIIRWVVDSQDLILRAIKGACDA
jgi:hypothetical protein